jgi:hypothetical protein
MNELPYPTGQRRRHTTASWLSEPAAQGPCRSLRTLRGKVMAFIADYNRTATPFRWTYDGRPLKAS